MRSLKSRFNRSVLALSVNFLLLAAFAASALADNPPVPGGAPGAAPLVSGPPQTTLLGMVTPFLMIFAVMYFLMIRPQQKKMKEQQAMLGALKQGDEVITASGMLGKVTGLTEKVVTLEVDDNVRVKMLKSQVTQVIKGQIKDLA